MAGIRKILKKIAKNIPVDGPHGPGFLTLEIEHPHEPGWKLLQGELEMLTITQHYYFPHYLRVLCEVDLSKSSQADCVPKLALCA